MADEEKGEDKKGLIGSIPIIDPDKLNELKVLPIAGGVIASIILALIVMSFFVKEPETDEKNNNKKTTEETSLSKTAQTSEPSKPVSELKKIKPVKKEVEPVKVDKKPPLPVIEKVQIPNKSWGETKDLLKRELKQREKLKESEEEPKKPAPAKQSTKPINFNKQKDWNDVIDLSSKLHEKIKLEVLASNFSQPAVNISIPATVVKNEHDWSEVSQTLNHLNQKSTTVLDSFRENP